MGKKYLNWIIMVVVLITSVSILVYTYITRVSVVYVDLTVLYNKFEYKIELERKFDATKQNRQAILDTMELELQTISRRIETGETDKRLIADFDFKRQQLIERSEFFEKDNEMQGKDYSDKIWVQLNQYLKEYRELKRYDFILGASGNGTIMASNPDKDITSEVIVFVNKRYNGK